MVLEAQLQQAALLKKVVEAMKDLCKDVNFDCSEKGIQVQSMDSSHVALVSLLLRECAFVDFKCDRPTSLGMNVESLSKVFKICGPNDSLKLKWQNDADTINFPRENIVDADPILNMLDTILESFPPCDSCTSTGQSRHV